MKKVIYAVCCITVMVTLVGFMYWADKNDWPRTNLKTYTTEAEVTDVVSYGTNQLTVLVKVKGSSVMYRISGHAHMADAEQALFLKPGQRIRIEYNEPVVKDSVFVEKFSILK